MSIWVKRLLYCAGLWALAPVSGVLTAQTGTLTGTVASREGEALAFSAVRLNGGNSILASDSGRFRLSYVPAGTATLRVQRIGYLPGDVEVLVQAGEVRDVRVVLTHVPVRLSEVRVTSHTCTRPGRPPGSDTALVTVLQQMTLNAEQFRLFSRSFPSVAAFTRRFSRAYDLASVDSAGRMLEDSVDVISRADIIALQSETEWRYRVGDVIQRDGSRGILPAYGVAIPNVAVFADNEFLAQHCFWDAGESTMSGVKERRIDFAVSDRVDEPDLNGSLFFDAGTFLIRRSIIALSKGSKATALYDSISVETEFAEVVPGVAIIARTRGASVLKKDEARSRAPERIRACLVDARDMETQYMTGIEFRDTSSSLVRIGAANVLAVASNGPASAKRIVSVTDRESKGPVLGAQVRDLASGTSVFTNRVGVVDLAWFPTSDTLTLVIDAPDYLPARVSVTGPYEAKVAVVELTRGVSPYSDKRLPFVTCPAAGR